MIRCPHQHCARCEHREGEYGPYWRYQPKELNELMSASGLIGGGPARNIFAGASPEVKAQDGHLEANMTGIEFYTFVKPDTGHAPCWPKWSGRRTGIIHPPDDPDLVLITARIVKRVD